MCELILENVRLKPHSHDIWLVVTAYTLARLFINSVIPNKVFFQVFFSSLLIFRLRFC